MKYEKANAEVVRFNAYDCFMALSGAALVALLNAITNVGGMLATITPTSDGKAFTCENFSNVTSQNVSFVSNGIQYSFTYSKQSDGYYTCSDYT